MVGFVERSDLAVAFRGLRLLTSFQSAVQKIQLFEHSVVGKILVIDGEVQHVEKWQALYHEPLVHLASAYVPEVRDVLILGGGSLFAAFEALRYSSLRTCTLVDHDRDILDLMSRYYPHASLVLRDSRFIYRQENAIEFINRTKHSYDLIVNDCFDTVKESETLGLPLFLLMTKRLTSGLHPVWMTPT